MVCLLLGISSFFKKQRSRTPPLALQPQRQLPPSLRPAVPNPSFDIPTKWHKTRLAVFTARALATFLSRQPHPIWHAGSTREPARAVGSGTMDKTEEDNRPGILRGRKAEFRSAHVYCCVYNHRDRNKQGGDTCLRLSAESQGRDRSWHEGYVWFVLFSICFFLLY